MPILTLEGVVENGQIRLRDHVTPPEHTKVYVVIPDVEIPAQAHVYSPRLAHPEQAVGFAKQIIMVRTCAVVCGRGIAPNTALHLTAYSLRCAAVSGSR
jgi:hypothetical protein